MSLSVSLTVFPVGVLSCTRFESVPNITINMSNLKQVRTGSSASRKLKEPGFFARPFTLYERLLS